MSAMVQPSLFSWDALEARSDLDRLHLVREHLPDGRVVQYLEVMRGHGRDDYPVRAMWNALLAGIVYQHEGLESLLRELARNPSLMEACGFDFLSIQRKPVPQVVNDPETGLVRIESPPLRRRYAPCPCVETFHAFWPMSLTSRRRSAWSARWRSCCASSSWLRCLISEHGSATEWKSRDCLIIYAASGFPS
ncbi:transposase [Thiorhodococcus mannitoliphagus]|uniref:Transposase n=2 Tax=Thiorhodococcus mannitoliphagus TaxID=329406 RepID=A0A6P1DZJ5_9GAMM|nr:transposase [Thiorhodococcus mannitoliphagus]